jgi:4-diphosphocytidyl-2-C-methyl-D-erythritol kinase
LNRLAGGPLTAATLAKVATGVGSDCALFLSGGPVVMRGRGEQVEALPAAVAVRLRGRRVLIFKPALAIATPWAYAQLAAQAPGGYLPTGEAEARLEAFVRAAEASEAWQDGLFNSLEGPAFAKYAALPVLLGQLRARFGLAPRMSGSGSACFAFLPDGAPGSEIVAAVRAAWGATALVVETRLA